MTEAQEQCRIEAIMGITPGHLKVLWGKVVERGAGLNFRVHGVHVAYQGVMETVRALPCVKM